MARVSFCSKADLGMLLQRRVSLLARAYSLPAYFYGSEIPYGGNTVNIHLSPMYIWPPYVMNKGKPNDL